MSRRGSFTAAVRRAARAHAAAERRHARQVVTARKQHAKAERAAYQNNRAEEAELQTMEVTERISELGSILQTMLNFNGYSIQSLRRTASLSDLPDGYDPGPPPSKASFTPPPLGFFGGLFASKVEAHKQIVASREIAYQTALIEYTAACARRDEAFLRITEEVDNHNQILLSIEEGAAEGNTEDMVTYAELILGGIPLPDGFSDSFMIGMIPSSSQLVVEFGVPQLESVSKVMLAGRDGG